MSHHMARLQANSTYQYDWIISPREDHSGILRLSQNDQRVEGGITNKNTRVTVEQVTKDIDGFFVD